MKRRTDQKIMDQTEELAALLALRFHNSVLNDCVYHETTNPKAMMCWRVACEIQELLTDTDPENAVANLEVVKPDTPLTDEHVAWAVTQAGFTGVTRGDSGWVIGIEAGGLTLYCETLEALQIAVGTAYSAKEVS